MTHYNTIIIGVGDDSFEPLGIDAISAMQDKEADRKEPDINKIALIRLQMLALAHAKMPFSFCPRRAQETARKQIGQLTTPTAKRRAEAITRKLFEETV